MISTPRAGKRARLDARLIALTFLALTIFFGAELLIDLRLARAPVSFAETTEWSRSFVSNLARAMNVLSQLVLTCVSLSVPLTSNMYTPKFVEVFLRDRVNQATLSFYLVAMGNSIFVAYVTRDGFEPSFMIHVLAAQFAISLATIVPYYFYLFRSLDPSSISAHLALRAEDLIDGFVAGARRGAAPTFADKDALRERIHHLGNLILRSLDRADRDVALEAVEALASVLRRYALAKPRLPDEWFHPDRRHFVSTSERAFKFLELSRCWVERTGLDQLDLAFQAAVQKAPDVVGDIAKTVREIGAEADAGKDAALLRLVCRFFNSFVREALRRNNLRAIYDLFHHYGSLARELLHTRPHVAADIGKWFRYYGELASATGAPYVCGLAAHDLVRVIESAYHTESPAAGPLLETLTGFQRVDGRTGIRILKSKVLLAAFLEAHDLRAELARVEEACRPCPPEAIRQVERDFADALDPEFWEVTDRQENFDHVPAERAPHVRAVLARLAAAGAGSPLGA